jgi:2-polyprenyl-3-methyl-5-hydroxy-6-metoxy-1,4-benzoquinol methylase
MNSKPEQIPADIETSSQGYADRFAGKIGAWMLQKQADITLNLLRDTSKQADILDVGGGHAQLVVPLLQNGYKVTVHGSDESCSKRIEKMLDGDQCKFICSSMFDLPFADHSFNTLLCFRLITHCDNWQDLIAELCRVADDHIIIDYPTGHSLNAIASGSLFSFKKKLEGNTRSWRLFTRKELESEFNKHGFVCDSETKQFFLPMVLHRTLRCPRLSAFLESICRGLGLTRFWGSPVIMSLKHQKVHAP